MRIDIITLFPEMFEGPLTISMLKKARSKGKVTINFVNLRDFGLGTHKQVDDTPYGGGDGMVLRADVVVPAIEAVKSKINSSTPLRISKQKGAEQSPKIILLTPQGKVYNQAMVRKLAKENHLILVCGHYEGFDERIRQFVDEEISIGQYIVTGGEIPAMVVVDSVVRLIPGVLGGENSAKDESFSNKNELEYPHYTRPPEFRGLKVPQVLQKGHHGEINKWRQNQTKHSSQ